MEKQGLIELLVQLKMVEGLKIKSISTDMHSQIRKLMRTDKRFNDMEHFVDPWHVIKNLIKKIKAKAKKNKFGKLGRRKLFWKKKGIDFWHSDQT